MRRLTAAIAFLWAGIETSGANYCRPEWRESIHVPQCLQGYSEGWSSVEVGFIAVATAIIFFVLGKAASLPSGVDKKKILDEVDKIIKGGKDVADRYGKKDKLEKPLDAVGTDIKKMLNDALPS